jgi:hypothetical protein
MDAPPKYHPGVTLTAVNQVVQAAGFRLLPVVPAVDGDAWQNFVLMPVPISGSRGGGDDYGRNLQVRW